MLRAQMSSFERSRGCCWAESFRSAAEIAANGGSITGALEFDTNKGAYLDGTNDYIRYGIGSTGQMFGSGFVSFVVEFTPNFDPSDLVRRFLFCDSTVSVYFYFSDGTGSLVCTINSASIASTLATYMPYWKSYGRNVLVGAYRNGVQTLWLNGVQIGTGTGASAVYTASAYYVVGARGNYTFKASAWIKSIKIFRHNAAAELFTVQDATDYYNRTRFSGTIARLKREGVVTLWADYRRSTQDMSGLGRDGVVTEPVVFGHNGASFQGVGRITHPDHVLGRNTTGSIVILGGFNSQTTEEMYFSARDALGWRIVFYVNASPNFSTFDGGAGASFITRSILGTKCLAVNYGRGLQSVFYANGALAGTAAAVLSAVPADDAAITTGNSYSGNGVSKSPIACVLETNRVLTAAEHWAVYREMSEQIW